MSITRRAFFVSVLALAGCLARSPSLELDDTDVVTLNVINHHRLNVTIYNVANGHRDRLGEVTAASNAQFKLHLRRYVANELQLFGDAVGSPETVTSDLLRLSPGDFVDWTLETELNRSSIAIR